MVTTTSQVLVSQLFSFKISTISSFNGSVIKGWWNSFSIAASCLQAVPFSGSLAQSLCLIKLSITMDQYGWDWELPYAKHEGH
jgi:hypothetical protein